MYIAGRTSVCVMLLLAAVASAAPTDPHEPWLSATPKTIQALRARSNQEVAERIDALDILKDDASVQGVIERYRLGDYLLNTLDYWVIAEARATWISKTVDPAFEKEVFAPMLGAFRRGAEQCDKAVKDVEAASTRPAVISPADAQQLGFVAKDNRRDQRLSYAFRLALLAKLANRPDLVAKVSEVLPLTRHVKGVRTPYASIEDFMTDKPNLKVWLRLAEFGAEGQSMSLPPGPAATKPAVPEQTRQHVQVLFEKYMAALAAKDAEALVPLFADPEQGKAVARQLNLGDISIRDVDLTKATFDFDARPDGTWSVRVDYVWMDIQKQQRDWKRVRSAIVLIAVEKNGVANLVSIGEKK